MGLIFYNIQQEQAEDEVRDESGEEEESEEEEIEVPFFSVIMMFSCNVLLDTLPSCSHAVMSLSLSA